jgi:hypothetical protein
MRPSSRHEFKKPEATPQHRARILQGAKKQWRAAQKPAIESSAPAEPEPPKGIRVHGSSSSEQTPIGRPDYGNLSEAQIRRDRMSSAIQSGRNPDPEDIAEEEADAERYQRQLAEARERKRKQVESEFAKQDQPETVQPKAQSGIQALRDEADRASEVLEQATELPRRKTPKPPLTISEFVGLILAFALAALAFVLTAPSAAGVTGVWEARQLLLAAWIVTIVGALVVEKLSGRSWKRVLITTVTSGLLMGVCLLLFDQRIASKKREQGRTTIPAQARATNKPDWKESDESKRIASGLVNDIQKLINEGRVIDTTNLARATGTYEAWNEKSSVVLGQVDNKMQERYKQSNFKSEFDKIFDYSPVGKGYESSDRKRLKLAIELRIRQLESNIRTIHLYTMPDAEAIELPL